MTIVDTLAARAGEVFGNGIPWSSFANEPPKDVMTKVEYYVPLAQEMRGVFAWSETVDWTWDVVNGPERPEALLAWGGVQAGILGKASVINAALEVGSERVGATDAPQFEREVLRAFFSQMFSLAMRGYEVHHQLLLQHAGVEPSKIVNNADMVFFTMRSLNRLHALGAFESFKKAPGGAAVAGRSQQYPSGQSSGSQLDRALRVGAITPALAGIIAVGSIAALIAIAWFITKMTVILAQWEIANAACAAAIRNPENPKFAEACKNAQSALTKTGKTKGPLDTLAIFGGIGLVVFAVGYGVLPNLKKGGSG